MNWILPTPRGIVFSLAAVGAVGVALINVGLGTALAAASLVGMVVASFLLALFSLYGFRVERVPSHDGERGTDLNMPLAIRNRGFFFRQAVVVSEKIPFVPGGVFRCVLPPMRPRSKIIFDRHVPARRRGFFDLKRVTLIGGDPAGLFSRFRHFRLPAEVMVGPEVVRLSELPVHLERRAILSPEGRPLGVSGSGQEFFGIREYRPSDELRFIHWKSTAAKRKLMVKEFEAGSLDQVTVILDSEKKHVGVDPEENNFEFLLKIAGSIFAGLSDMYCRVQFITFTAGGEKLRIRGDASSIHTELINSLAIVQPGAGRLDELLDYGLELIYPNSIFYCLTMSENAMISAQLEEFAANHIEVRWIMAPRGYFPVIDPELPRVIRKALPEPEGCMLKPRVVNFTTNINELLCHETGE
jgi:uncharacterized protein (DUF58 family)